MRIALLSLLTISFLVPASVTAQSAYQELQESIPAEVIAILETSEERIPGTDAMTTMQTLQARLKGGDVVTFETDRTLLSVGDRVYLDHIETINGDTFYQLRDIKRHGPLIALAALLAVLIVWFAGKQGVRAVLSLGVSIAAILFLLVPALLAGYDPVLVSLVLALVILAAALFGTHGIHPTAGIAYAGTSAAVAVTSIVAWLAVDALRLSGFSADASVYLNFATDGRLDFSGLLLGSIIIGMLGVLDDVAVTQASVVGELKAANPSFAARELYRRAIRVGRDHVGSLINTLALAYVGAALPLVLLFATSDAPLALTFNQEVVVTEMARIIVGSIGIVLAVPFTTLIAAWWFKDRTVTSADVVGHSHHH